MGGDGDGNVHGSWWDPEVIEADAWHMVHEAQWLMSEFESHGKFWSLGPQLAYLNEACIKLQKKPL